MIWPTGSPTFPTTAWCVYGLSAGGTKERAYEGKRNCVRKLTERANHFQCVNDLRQSPRSSSGSIGSALQCFSVDRTQGSSTTSHPVFQALFTEGVSPGLAYYCILKDVVADWAFEVSWRISDVVMASVDDEPLYQLFVEHTSVLVCSVHRPASVSCPRASLRCLDEQTRVCDTMSGGLSTDSVARRDGCLGTSHRRER